MEQRQRRHKAVVSGKVGDGFDLLDVGQQAFMTVHHPFRVALRAGGEEDHRRVFRLLLNLRQTRRQQMAENPQFVCGGDIAFEIFQEHPTHLGQLLRQVPELAFIEEGARGKNGLEFRGGDGAAESFHPGGIVHHRRNAPAGDRAENHRRTDAGVGQHQAYLLTLLAIFFQNAGDKQGFGQQLAIGIRLEVDILHAGFARAEAVLRRQQRLIQGFPRAHRHPGLHHDLMQHFPGDFAPVAGARRLGHRQMGRRQQVQLNPREQATLYQPLQPAEGRQFSAFNAQRHDSRLRFGGDKGGAVINFHQRAADRDSPFREDDHRPPLFDQAHQMFDRHRLGRVQRHKIDNRRQRAHKPALAD